jgi:hypothetical protein
MLDIACYVLRLCYDLFVSLHGLMCTDFDANPDFRRESLKLSFSLSRVMFSLASCYVMNLLRCCYITSDTVGDTATDA